MYRLLFITEGMVVEESQVVWVEEQMITETYGPVSPTNASPIAAKEVGESSTLDPTITISPALHTSK